MKDDQKIKHWYNSAKNCKPIKTISTAVIAVTLAILYLSFAWQRYHRMAEMEIMHLAKSVASLLHVEHIETLGEQEEFSDEHLVEQSLTHLVEVTDSIYYAYILKQQDQSITIAVDSSAADSATSAPTKRICEETIEINRIPFNTGQAIITEPISNPCGNWIRALVPILDTDKDIIAVLGLNYSGDEWYVDMWEKMIPDIIVVACIATLVFMLLSLLEKNSKYREAEKSRQESERSKFVFFSQLPGMAYRCKYDPYWTMEFVSQGCFELTGYKAESFINNKDISFNDIIAPEHRELVHDEWERVLMQHKHYRDEYEIVTKSDEHKWVFEMGQGIYDELGNVVALEGIVMDISVRKKKDLQITYLKERDFLTGLYNRNYMEQERKRLDQPNYLPLSIVICDIDGLRVINDAYGHEEGDHLIVKTAQLIQNCMRNEYVLGHTGGGEFMILLPHTDTEGANNLKTKIDDSIESYNRVKENTRYDISVSIGHSTKETMDQEVQNVINEADEYLRRRKILNQNSYHSSTVSSIMASLYAKSQETEEHGQRLGRLCMIIGEQMNLSQTELDDLQLLSKLHDVGKIGIDDYILNKPGKLSKEEWEIMKRHPEIGCRIAMATPQLKHIAKYILYHHERWDGTGYPKGLKGEEIPLLSRILSIADAYDAMTEDRVYRKALSKEDALGELERNIGSQFDPDIAMMFIRMLKENNES